MWFTPRALLLHLVLLLVFPGFLFLAWWQLHRALSGNDLSWAYTFEWPFFAAYAAFVWWKLVHDQKRRTGSPPMLSAPAQRPVGWALGGRSPGGDHPASPGHDHSARPVGGHLAEPVAASSPSAAADLAAATAGASHAAAGSAAPPVDGWSGGRHDEGRSAEDRALDEYNDYLAALNASGRRKRW